MTSANMLLITGICLLLGAVGYAIRRKFPEIAIFFGGIAMCSAGLWTIISTLEMAEQGEAQRFSRKIITFSKSAEPEAFAWSYWGHLGLGAFIFLVGTYFLVAPFTKRGRQISFQQMTVTKPSSAMGVLRLLGISFVLFVFIWFWRNFFG